MPTVIVVDVSLSMLRPVVMPDTEEEYQRRHLAIHGINTLLDHFAVHCKLEFVSLMAFSSLYEVVSPFTRDFDSIKSKLSTLEQYDKTCIETALHGVKSLIIDEWGNSSPCQVVLVTDGNTGIGPMSLKHTLATLNQKDPTQLDKGFSLPFPFPTKFSIMCIASPEDHALQLSLPLYQKLIELGGDGNVYIPEEPFSIKSVQAMFTKLAEANFSSFRGTLHCGNLSSYITLSPPPQPYAKAHDFEMIRQTVSENIHICGFIDIVDVASPSSHSRHLVLPLAAGKGDSTASVVKVEPDSEDESVASGSSDDGKVPSFCVLLHGALKVENMVALCQVAEDWFGIMYSWADSKKKSNLMLSLFEPGSQPVAWLGNLKQLQPLSERQYLEEKEGGGSASFPVKPAEKRSYSQSCVVWIRQAGLQSDIQKILRHARKLPDKTQHFYKELNRLKKAALSFGFYELLDGLAAIFERECTLLPGTVHPDCALQLTHAANVLRQPQSRDLKYTVIPLRTKFTSDD